MKRHNARISAIVVLYNIDLNKLMFNEAENVLIDTIERINEDEIVEIDQEFASLLVSGVLLNLNDIDNLISNNLVNYTIDRLSYVDRAIIRTCVYEMKYLKLDPRIAIDEACEITREYSNIDLDKQVKFNNKVLDTIRKSLYE